MEPKYLALTPELYDYVVRYSGAPNDDILSDLRAHTESLGTIAGMQISSEQGALLTLLAMGAKNALEIGTFTGYSSTCIARALAPGGKLLCLDISDEWTKIAREFWAKDGVADRIELRIGSAQESLAAVLEDEHVAFDFVFIDADKPNYDLYYEMVLPRVRPNGWIIFDNMLWHGRVLDPSDNHESTVAIRALNDKLAADTRVVSGLISVGDGLHICRKIG